MRRVRFLLGLSIFLCFLAAIWSRDRVQWTLTGLYAYAVTRYVGNVFNGNVVGEEIQRDRRVLSLTNLIGKK